MRFNIKNVLHIIDLFFKNIYKKGEINMNISIETKFNVNDKVYFIEYRCKYNDYYNDEMWWKVGSDFDDRKAELHIVKAIEIRATYKNNSDKTIEIYYLLDNNVWYQESLLFYNLEEAENKCKEKNKGGR